MQSLQTKLSDLDGDRANKMNSEILMLENLTGEGNARLCWLHPHDNRYCIKTEKPNQPRPQNIIEWHYSQRLLRKSIDSPYITPAYEKIQTNKGIGLVYEMIYDYDGSISKPIDKALKQKTIDAISFANKYSAYDNDNK